MFNWSFRCFRKNGYIFYHHFGIKVFDQSEAGISLGLTWASNSLSAEKLQILKLIFLHLEQFCSRILIVM